MQNKSDSAAVETTPRGQSVGPLATLNSMLLLANGARSYAYFEISDSRQTRSLEINAVKITPRLTQEKEDV